MSINLRHEIKATAVKCVFFFSFCPQLQHCLPVYLLLPRAHSQSSGGAQLHEPPPAAHHKLSGAAPAGSPGALVPRTEGSPEEPLRQGTALFRLLLGFLSLGYKRTGWLNVLPHLEISYINLKVISSFKLKFHFCYLFVWDKKKRFPWIICKEDYSGGVLASFSMFTLSKDNCGGVPVLVKINFVQEHSFLSSA